MACCGQLVDTVQFVDTLLVYVLGGYFELSPFEAAMNIVERICLLVLCLNTSFFPTGISLELELLVMVMNRLGFGRYHLNPAPHNPD